MSILDEMTYYWSGQVAREIADKTKVLLESKSDLLLQNDRCLTDNWEGFCAQLQAEKSVIEWDRGIEVIHTFLYRYYTSLPQEEQFTVWIQTDDGKNWLSTGDSDRFSYDEAPYDFTACLELLMTLLIEMAIAFKNDNIINYVDFDCQGIQTEDDDFEEEEEEYDD